MHANKAVEYTVENTGVESAVYKVMGTKIRHLE